LQSHLLPNGKLRIVESSAPNVATGEFLFEGSLGLDQLDGSWRSADGKHSYPVHLETIFEEQYDELPKIWSARPKLAAAKVPREPPGPVLHTRQQIETPISLRGPNGITLLASIQANEDGATVRIWRPIDDGFQLSYETNSKSGISVATYDVEAFCLSGEYFVHLMLLDSGTGYFHIDTFLWIAPDVTLQRAKFVEAAKAYRGLGKGEGVWKGEVDQFRDDNATFRFGVWREGDANADPTGGQVKGHYKLTGGKQYHSETKQWSQDFQIVPADFTRFAPEHQ